MMVALPIAPAQTPHLAIHEERDEKREMDQMVIIVATLKNKVRNTKEIVYAPLKINLRNIDNTNQS
jgi:hypothetical protein